MVPLLFTEAKYYSCAGGIFSPLLTCFSQQWAPVASLLCTPPCARGDLGYIFIPPPPKLLLKYVFHTLIVQFSLYVFLNGVFLFKSFISHYCFLSISLQFEHSVFICISPMPALRLYFYQIEYVDDVLISIGFQFFKNIFFIS